MSKTKRTVLFVPVDGPAEERAIKGDELRAMQALVGGYIEPVRLTGRTVIYVNEEGIRLGLAYNPRLSLLASMQLLGDGFIENPTDEIKHAMGLTSVVR